MSLLLTRPGLLRHRLILQTVNDAADGQGGFVKAWTDTATVWGSLEPLSGRELLQAQQVQSRVTHKSRLRYRSDVTVTPAMRIKKGTRTFNVQEVRNVEERNVYLDLMLEEGTGE